MSVIRNCLVILGLAVLSPAAHAQVNADTAKTLAEKNLCFSCHKAEEKLVGPSFRDVANKYKGVAEADAKLIANIKKGGKGLWGTVPMPPTNGVSDEDLKTIAAWILALSSR